MTLGPTTDDARVTALEQKVQELETLVNLALRLLAMERPVSTLLQRYGATGAEDLAVHSLLDDVAVRAERDGKDAPSLSGFVHQLGTRFPAVRGDATFLSLLFDALRLDRAAYQKLHAYASAHGWLQTPGRTGN
jgi:hypothetical protein